MRKIWIVLGFLAALTVSPAYGLELPQAEGWVNDFAGVISTGYRDKLTALISELEEKTSSEIAVVTVSSLGGHDEKEYARLIFDNWKPGKKGKDNGVLVLIAIQERRWRIETGYGVEGFLPDGVCGEIGRNYMVPSFKQGNYGEGLYYGVAQIARIIAKEAQVEITNAPVEKVRSASNKVPVFLYLFIPLFFFIWNLPWPLVIGLPFNLFFAFVFFTLSPVLGLLTVVSYIASLLFRYNYWNNLPADKRKSFFGPQSYGGRFTSGGFGGGGFGGGGFGGGGGGGGGW